MLCFLEVYKFCDEDFGIFFRKSIILDKEVDFFVFRIGMKVMLVFEFRFWYRCNEDKWMKSWNYIFF